MGDGSIDIGGGVSIDLCHFHGVLVGLTEYHRHPDGELCGGYITFSNVPEAQAWADAFTNGHLTGHRLISADPLTIEASIGCKRCTNHGFIRGGRWEAA